MQIETERLLLVPVSEQHTGEVYRHFNEKVIAYMFPGVLKDRREAEEVIRRFMDQQSQKTDYVYAITKKETGEFIGLAGLHHMDQTIPELGIWTKIDSHGNHYGREAIGGLIRHAAALGKKKLRYPVDRRNVPSKKIPLFYRGKLVGRCREVPTPDGRTLQEEVYEIEI